MTTISPKIEVSEDAIASFCDRWKITEFALFGSILRDDFRPDVDTASIRVNNSSKKEGRSFARYLR